MGKTVHGKSTLSRLIAGITLPSKGSILVNGIDVSDKSKFIDLRKNIGIVFQNPENQIVFDKVYDDIAFGMKNLHFENNLIHTAIENSLNKVNMSDYIYSDSHALSLGQKQRIAIASSLAVNPKILIFDEPTAMLDPKGKKDICNIIKSLHNEGCTTIVYVTNVIDEILLADRIIGLENGCIKHEFKKSDILDNIDVLEEMELELPSIFEIILGLKAKGIDIDVSRFDMQSLVDKLAELIKNDKL